MRKLAFALFTTAAFAAVYPNPELLEKAWTARWISAVDASRHDYGVYHFRRTFDLPAKPMQFPVHVTGDNRYILYVNGVRVSEGPARGDLYRWRYESLDISPYLRAGRNALAAVVWNDGQFTGYAQISNETGFLLQGDTDAQAAVNTGANWKAVRDAAYTPNPVAADQVTGYFAIGPLEVLDAAKYPWGWERTGFDDSTWLKARVGSTGEPRGSRDGKNRWMLVQSNLPAQERKAMAPPRVRKTGFDGQFGDIPANTKATFLLDQEELTTGYPRFTFSGGKAARVGIRYSEGLWKTLKPFGKGDRNEVDGKTFLGYQDVYLADGGVKRAYEPLWWRTWRYMEVTIQTAAEPLKIDGMEVFFSGYPFERKYTFASKPEDFTKILDVGWRTARLCAHETYMDCPYYEQLQYAGDTRIQGLVSIYNSGDTRLLRNAIEQIDSSRASDGLTFSRAPSAQPQYIPGFSLWWIGMVHDYWRYVDDPDFVKQMLPGVRAVLGWFSMHQKDDRLLGKLPWWNYLDWTVKWDGGVPPASAETSSAAFQLELAMAYKWAQELEQAVGNPNVAQQHRTTQGALLQSIRKAFYDEDRGLFSDTLEHKDFSQQANALAVLSGAVSGDLAKSVMTKALSEKNLTQASTYFLAYVHDAMKEAGMGDRYIDQLGMWKTMLGLNLTTWAENLNRDRSDCHAWGSSPNYQLYRTVLGIDSAAAGFKKVRIEPNLGELTEASGEMPHPKGKIAVKYALVNGKWRVEIELPAETTGDLIWKGQRRGLRSGKSTFVL